MSCRSNRRKFLVGIEFDSPYDNKGYFELERTASLQELAEEILGIQLQGHRFPTFPSSAHAMFISP